MYVNINIIPATLLIFIPPTLISSIKRTVTPIITGASKVKDRGSTGTDSIRAGTPIPIKILNVLLPRIVPMERSCNPFIAEDNVTTNSGMLVPIANVNSPIIISGIPAIWASSTPL